MTSLDPTSILSTLQTWSTNLKTNLSNSVTSLTLRDYIRLIWIIGGYLFLRPYLDSGFRKLFTSNMDKSDAEEKAQEQAELEAAAVGSVGARAKLSANALRGALGDDSESNEEEDGTGETTGVPQWGRSARRRQRRVLRKLEEAALRHKEEEDDKDIADLLEG
ncbi:hypothetical protein PAAG_03980 [Paracoccidioides lutzii Pb01]|uniref:Uncharacterized protein n=1 Tax=Paracoccidioides lutzii (strain ATCC MYA-826 / Pb01) TaxID=502779 RepID=C1GZN6_PARBA|nr:hypothetical protein PAAG_03980 [Paracoccidioides lutzii Pb01]EEH42059.1 hypothetical protein PAAG_03980 [Paracoccidioides lutzii Pb01]